MTDSWEDMRKAKEEAYFKKQNEKALEKIAEQQSQSEESKPAKKSFRILGLIEKLKQAIFPD